MEHGQKHINYSNLTSAAAVEDGQRRCTRSSSDSTRQQHSDVISATAHPFNHVASLMSLCQPVRKGQNENPISNSRQDSFTALADPALTSKSSLQQLTDLALKSKSTSLELAYPTLTSKSTSQQLTDSTLASKSTSQQLTDSTPTSLTSKSRPNSASKSTSQQLTDPTLRS